MIRNFVLLLLVNVFVLSLFTQAQNNDDAVLLTIGGEDVKLSEFLNVYRKNSSNGTMDKSSLEEYLNLFIHYKLKIKEAETLGMDTSSKFVSELLGYKKQLIQPYLIDKETADKLIHEAYERLQYDVKASHILIRVAPKPLPADTLAAFNKIVDIRKRLVNGEDFAKIADEISPGSNGGNLGYFTALQMTYPFETASYTTPVGEVSQPVRTTFGYHLIKVTDKRKAVGQIRVAHIFVKSNEKMNEQEHAQQKQKIDDIYQQLKSGVPFEELANKFSEDHNTATKGGMLNWFGVDPTKGMLPEFESASFALQNNGDFSDPVKTTIGWHIIKRLDHKPIEEYEKMNPELKLRVSKDGRSILAKKSLIEKIKKEYGYTPNLKAKNEFYKIVDVTIMEEKWSAEKANALNKILFTLTDNKYSNKKQDYTQKDFAAFLEENQNKKGKDMTIREIVDFMFNGFVEDKCMQFEESILEQKYAELKTLLQEYRDGILLFELSDDKIWSKAITDTVGLKEYYEAHTTDFMWGKRLNASIYTCKDVATAEKAKKILAKKDKKGYSHEDIKNLINKETPDAINLEEGVYQEKDNDIIDKIYWAEMISDNLQKDGKVIFVVVNKVIPPTPKSLADAKGLVTSSYQKFLEEQWLTELKTKYPVKVNKEVLTAIVK